MSSTKRRATFRVVAIDTETTGLGHKAEPPRPDGVVQVGIAWRDPQNELRTWERNCHPGEAFLKDGRAGYALSVSRLTESEIRSSPPSRKIAAELRVQLTRLASEGPAVELRAFNRAFDEPFMTASPWSIRERWGPCLMIAAYDRFGGLNPGRIPLWKALQEAGINGVNEQHRAGADARAALLLHEAMERGYTRGN